METGKRERQPACHSLGAAAARIGARERTAVTREHTTHDQRVEYPCAPGALQAEQACRLWERQVESGHLAKLRPHSRTEVVFDTRT